MIPPHGRHNGDTPKSAAEECEEALHFIFNEASHEAGDCGPAEHGDSTFCKKCIAKAALLKAGWELTADESMAEAVNYRMGVANG